jgi:predicted amidohydrolase
VRIAIVQSEQRAGNLTNNVDRALEGVASAADAGADLVALPALFAVGYYAVDSYARRAEPLGGPTLRQVAAAAADHGVHVLGGTVVEDLAASAAAGHAVPEADGYANTAVLFGPDGNRLSVTRSSRLLGYAAAGGWAAAGADVEGGRLDRDGDDGDESGETDATLAGAGDGDPVGTSVSTKPVVDVGPFTVGVTTAADLTTPGAVEHLSRAGATLVLTPAGWPYPHVEAWEALTGARAVENACYVAAVNGVGEFDERTLLGRSCVRGPTGAHLAGADDAPAVVTADLDPERVASVRATRPSHWAE